VALLDVAKGFAPALAATLVVGHLAGALAGAAAMLGHWRPVFLRFAKAGRWSPRAAAHSSGSRRWSG
jgi:glycerol-3-phosphate acyltransferase PlsY